MNSNKYRHNLKYNILNDASEIKNIIESHFDTCFWELHNIEFIKEALSLGTEYILLSNNDKPCCLTSIIEVPINPVVNIKLIAHIEVSKHNSMRRTGIGTQFIKLLKETIYSDYKITGFATDKTLSFWEKNSTCVSKLNSGLKLKNEIENKEMQYKGSCNLDGLSQFWL